MSSRPRPRESERGSLYLDSGDAALKSGRKSVLTLNRPSSTITQTMLDGRRVYVKEYIHGDWGRAEDVVNAQVAREVELLERCRASDLFRGRLGVLQLVLGEDAPATIVTEEVAGSPLDGWLRPDAGLDCLIALFLSGRWLRQFQKLSVRQADFEQIGDCHPPELVEYCDIRMKKLMSLGYVWPIQKDRGRVKEVLLKLMARSNDSDRDFVWSHCDYGPGNVLWDGQKLTGIDLATARMERRLLDVTYFIHRLEMLPIYFPWRRWPVAAWTRAFLRGYGRPDAAESPMYRALMIRHFLCRLQTYVRRPLKGWKQQIHNRWVRRCVRRELEKRIAD